jgi:N-acetyl-gamma-glutamyl-phosphate reductase
LFPATGDVLGSNTLALGVSVDAAVNRVIVVAALDNLVKGTAGAALQSVNLALGLEESSGLTTDGIAP